MRKKDILYNKNFQPWDANPKRIHDFFFNSIEDIFLSLMVKKISRLLSNTAPIQKINHLTDGGTRHKKEGETRPTFLHKFHPIAKTGRDELAWPLRPAGVARGELVHGRRAAAQGRARQLAQEGGPRWVAN